MLLKLLNLLAFILPTLVFARRARISPVNGLNFYLTPNGIGNPITLEPRPYIWNINPVIPNRYVIQTGDSRSYASLDTDSSDVITDANSQDFVIECPTELRCYISVPDRNSFWTIFDINPGVLIEVNPENDSSNQEFRIIYLD